MLDSNVKKVYIILLVWSASFKSKLNILVSLKSFPQVGFVFVFFSFLPQLNDTSGNVVNYWQR